MAPAVEEEWLESPGCGVPDRGGDGAPEPHRGGRIDHDRVEGRPKKLQEVPLLGWLLELAGHLVETGVDLARTQVPQTGEVLLKRHPRDLGAKARCWELPGGVTARNLH